MNLKLKNLVNIILAVSLAALAFSGFCLFFQIWIDGLRGFHDIASLTFILAGATHMLINRKALWAGLKTKPAAAAALLILVLLCLPLLLARSVKTPPVQKSSGTLADISLPEPHQAGGKPLMQALKERQTRRAFSDKKLPEPMVADLLWAAFGINRPDTGKRTAPSARNWQEIEIYAVMADGAYIYDPQANQLHAVALGDHRQGAGMQGFVAKAPLVLVYVADSAKAGSIPADDFKFYSGIDTGFVSQNVYLFCASEGLATVVLGTVDRDALAAALGLASNQRVVLVQPVGYPN